MTAKEYLQQAQYLEEIIEGYNRDKKYWEALSEEVSGINFEEHIKSSNSKTNAAFVAILEKIDEIKQKIAEETAKKIALRAEIKLRISMLTDQREQLVLQYKYLENCTNEETARLIGKSVSTVNRIHRDALKKISVPN